ncbi:hypothetical protein [Mucilaginibacter sp. UR6-11]|uniref:hypothetical protein n=1 Tax=Mucilaginibacter sp. UR6-11 TaxID=1435644 RepID=UPI001E4F05FD|nr:hypothetical protein [Mucilaginibacter sp. UR6-11]MCC8423670.1 hypothetical protein [Mucilaginibacter sp. UR6-11]
MENDEKKSWYAHIYGDPFDPKCYYKTNKKSEFCIGKLIGSIYADGTGVHPDEFSAELKELIADALMSGISQPEERDKTVVFMKH